MTYRAVLFDLFDTLVLFHRDRLPEIQVNGRRIRSTAGHLHAAFRPFAPHVELPAFVEALFWSWQEAERLRADDHREVAAPERFGLLFGRLELEPSVEARDLLRYLSSELNRLYFQLWNGAQIVLGVLALWLIADSAKTVKWGIAAMLASVVLMLVYLTPAIVTLGRSLDFVPRDPAPPGMSRFWILHAAYTSLEMLKLVVGVVVATTLARQRGERLPSPSTAAA